jgi:hypothetical protein
MPASIQKKEREMAQKARAQMKRQRKIERRQQAAKASQNPGATDPILAVVKITDERLEADD